MGVCKSPETLRSSLDEGWIDEGVENGGENKHEEWREKQEAQRQESCLSNVSHRSKRYGFKALLF